MIALAAFCAGKPARDPLDQSIFVDRKLDHIGKHAVALGQYLVQRFGLGGGAGIAVKDNALFGAEFIELVADNTRNYLIRHQFACFHQRLGLQPDFGSGIHGGAQHVSGRQLDHAMFVFQKARLGSLPGTRWPQQDDVHAITPVIMENIMCRLSRTSA